MKLVLFARWPTPGAAKTRLIPALGAAGAAALHGRLVERTLGVMRATGLAMAARVTGAPPADFAAWLGGDVACVDQGGGDLGARMARAAADPPVVLLGADTPDLTAAHVMALADALADAPVAIGPAEDGGYWGIGLAAPVQTLLFDEMRWGVETVLSVTLARLFGAGITPAFGPTLADLDRPEDLARWPALLA